MPEPTIRQLAELAGVSPTAASLALRDSPKISRETIERVKRIAAECGYRVNPMVSSLMAHMRATKKTISHVASIAFITPHRIASSAKLSDIPTRIFTGAKDRAVSLGYTVEEIPYQDLGLTPQRLNKILTSRGVCGLVLHHLTDLGALDGLEWSRFSLISAGGVTTRPRLHHVQMDHINLVSIAMREAIELGYRRPGLCLHACRNRITEHRYIAAYVSFQTRLEQQCRVPSLCCEADGKAVFLEWLRTEKPDVVVTNNSEIKEWILAAGLRIPAEIGLIDLDVKPGPTACAGIYQNRSLVGATAIELVVAEHQRNERGIPEFPKATLIGGHWSMGESVRQVSLDKPDDKAFVLAPPDSLRLV